MKNEVDREKERPGQYIDSLCLSAQMRIASAILHKNAISFFADCAVSR